MSKVLGEKDVNAPIAEQILGKDKDVKEIKEIKEVKEVKEVKEAKEVMEVMEKEKEKEKGKDVKSMEYHRQIFQSKMAQEKAQKYISPSDSILSPASAKISALRSKSVAKAKPRSLFAQASAKKLNSDNPFGAGPP